MGTGNREWAPGIGAPGTGDRLLPPERAEHRDRRTGAECPALGTSQSRPVSPAPGDPAWAGGCPKVLSSCSGVVAVPVRGSWQELGVTTGDVSPCVTCGDSTAQGALPRAPRQEEPPGEEEEGAGCSPGCQDTAQPCPGFAGTPGTRRAQQTPAAPLVIARKIQGMVQFLITCTMKLIEGSAEGF